ncbi:unnamed protein product [Paramecium sonneborni]|uniref:Uncharacterized protein n=1 Tax=Paramecium sonneborni TaxID=65129 RepID=A0A8S1RW82_9CILI|nr:unnamed protein product [Paramecium sonneborni]
MSNTRQIKRKGIQIQGKFTFDENPLIKLKQSFRRILIKMFNIQTQFFLHLQIIDQLNFLKILQILVMQNVINKVGQGNCNYKIDLIENWLYFGQSKFILMLMEKKFHFSQFLHRHNQDKQILKQIQVLLNLKFSQPGIKNQKILQILHLKK